MLSAVKSTIPAMTQKKTVGKRKVFFQEDSSSLFFFKAKRLQIRFEFFLKNLERIPSFSAIRCFKKSRTTINLKGFSKLEMEILMP